MNNPTALVEKLRNYCNILRDDVLSYGDYVEQLTFLLFLKMAAQQSRLPFNNRSALPAIYACPSPVLKGRSVVARGKKTRRSRLGKPPAYYPPPAVHSGESISGGLCTSGQFCQQ
jgi:type I restriction enzyme M protein